ncbi:MAG: efflux RND transporter permease subunit [Thermoanaerobaculales bacterium]|jgi:multidrug efflux pump|nr:efflux RND transporter permease subunit [Thermoanaerobaculales bacterium]
MTLYTLSIRRPVLAIVMSMVIVLFGALGFSYLGVREFPSLDPPNITVSTSYRGASAEVVESQITEPIEASVNGVDGIRTLTSASREGRSTVQAEFDLGTDLERAANDVRDKVSQATSDLPPDAEPPIVSKADADAQPIIGLSVRSDTRNALELSRLAQEVFVERLQTIPNVASVEIWGEKTTAMRLWIDPQRLAGYRLSPLDVRDAVARENVELPSGRIEGDDVELPVRTMSRLETPEDFNDLILSTEADRIIRLRDVGYAELGPLNLRTVLKRNGVPMVLVVVRPQPGANSIAIADEVKRRVETIERNLPSDVETAWAFDASRFIRKSVAEVKQTIVVAFILVMLVIFLFLRDWRTTLIPVVVIPVSLIGAFFIMFVAGFSLNVLTLLAMVLAIGLVVDDAIVVVEVIYARIEAGKDPTEAGIEGTREIFFAVVATTVALVAVFMPIMFLGGLVGRLFREFGLTLAGAVVISSFVALTLTPMLSTRLLKRRQRHSLFYTATEPFFRGLASAYRGTLTSMLERRWLAVPVLLVCLGLVALFLEILPRELAPLEDRSQISLTVRGPEGATFEYMDRFMDRVNALVLAEVPELDNVVTVTAPGFGAASSVNSGFGRINLLEPEDRERSQAEIAAALAPKIAGLTEARSYLSQSPTIAVGRRRGLPVQFVIQAANMAKLEEVLPRFLAAAEADPTFDFVDVDLKFDKPELQVTIDRERAQDLGISALRIAQTLQLALSEQRLGYFVMDGKQYEVIGQVTGAARNETADLRNLYVTTGDRPPVVLDKLVRVAETSSPPQIFRFDRYESATVSAALAPGRTLGEGIDAMRAIADELLDETFATTLAGESRDFAESASSLLFVFVLALVLVYLVLAAQFESFRDPLIIMLTVPLALAGALLSLWYFNQTVNIFSQIGMIMLIGLVTKNGILIVEFANQRKAAGATVTESIIDGATARFRPVLMTSLSTVLGILPIALGLGAGAESRIPMGVAVIGGMMVGTFLTLYVVPAMCSYLTSRTGRVSRFD